MANRADWLPKAPRRRRLRSLPWWQPAGVRERLNTDEEWAALRYVVVDELHEGVAGLVVSPWPHVDERGRLLFEDEDEITRVATSAEAMHALLRDERASIVPVDAGPRAEEQLRDRELAIGDVFVARIGDPPGEAGGGGPGGEPLADPHAVLGKEMLDITAEAREATKLQATAAASGVMDEALVITICEELVPDEAPEREDGA